MKKILLFNVLGNTEPLVVGDYEIHSFDYNSFFSGKEKRSLSSLFTWGVNGYNIKRSITANALWVDELYRTRNPIYMKMMDEFVEKFENFDVLVMSSFNFVHPDILKQRLSKPTKVLGFIDDPYSTYSRGIPYLWAFDATFYISPSYFNSVSMRQSLSDWSGGKPTTWWPLVPRPHTKPDNVTDDFFSNRTTSLCYIGNHNGNKVDKLIALKDEFKDEFKLHGRWPLKGYSGLIRALDGKRPLLHRVTSVTNEYRRELYWDTKIGFNMHVSNEAFETGNMRMYEVPAHGAMLLCDKANLNLHEQIFLPDVEACYYESLDEAIDMVKYFSKPENDAQRCQIAKQGFERFWKDYEWERNLLKFLDWTITVA
ncbi:glycosyltransferase [Colwellia psychrerythraea]|uniref:Spore protein YkvP/CgeB glycosyl transferase-like domain-containing protein n=1 Tax=Colwellia psychrerythraea TaxID=28229 RepID=A0A099KIT5_COLPS|nr:glycosyltransferase [Colwellia psychrerythraea]KGJ89907.1 hypothetical protein GAB14E_3785 [Colwellia psychrerythraea]